MGSTTLVTSSTIKGIDYKSHLRTLVITFHTGRVYEYSPVEPQVVFNFLTSESKGKFFHLNIKDKYRFKRVK